MSIRDKFLKIATGIAFLAFTTSSSMAWPWTKTPEQALSETLSKGLNQDRQATFKVFHPTGTATRIEVHDVKIAWRNDRPTGELSDIVAYGVRFTIYWKGPITTDGFTKVHAVYDNESKRWIKSEILATNGITNEQAEKAAFNIGYAIGNALGAQ